MSSFNQDCLAAHNVYRRQHGAPPLVLNDWLTSVAQNWANTLAAQGRMYHNPNRPPNVGENLYGSSGTVTSGRTAVDCFYNEIRYYNFKSPGFSSATGHFTAVVWKSTTKMGVAKAKSRNGWTYVVCNYSPAGNVQGRYGANVLPRGTAPPPQPQAPTPSKPTQSTKPSQPSQPTQSSNTVSDKDSLVTKPAVRSSYLNAPPAEIVAAIFNGKLGNCMGDRMKRGYHLSTNQYLMSENHKYAAILQEDGNFVVYNRDKGGEADFATDTDGEPANQVQLRNNGLFAIVDKSNLENPLWKSHKDAEGEDCILVMRNDGKLIAYRGTSEDSDSAPKDCNGQNKSVGHCRIYCGTEMDTYAKECLDAHNEYRRKHGSPPLVLSPWLMGVAQDWANNNASRGMMYHSNHPNDCENIFATGGRAVSGREPADCFYSEIKHYRFGGMGFTMQTGHFTQMVWKSTTMMGVGKATGRNGWTYVVVSYSPRGNVQGQFGSNVLPLGTPLPAGSTPRAASVAPAAAASTPRPSAPIARTTYKDAPPSEIVAAIFSGKLGTSIGHRMEHGYHLTTNQYLMSENGQYVAILQEDGNFVLYNRNKGGQADFASNTWGKPANQVQLRHDGHIAVVNDSNPDSPFWMSRRNTNGGACFLIMQNDGNLVGYRGTHDTNPNNAYFSAWNLNL